MPKANDAESVPIMLTEQDYLDLDASETELLNPENRNLPTIALVADEGVELLQRGNCVILGATELERLVALLRVDAPVSPAKARLLTFPATKSKPTS